MARLPLIAITAFLLSACATTEPAATSSLAAETRTTMKNADEVGTADSAKSADATETDESQKVVCRDYVITGSRFSKKVCRRQATIDQASDDNQAALRQMRATRSGSQNATNGGGGDQPIRGSN